jgi:hypothetical protein
MNQVAQRRGFVFDLPASSAEYSQKHHEVEQSLNRYQALLDRQGLFFELMEEIHSQLIANGQGIHAERLRNLVILEINKDFKIRLSEDCAWLVEWNVIVDDEGILESRDVFAVTYNSIWEYVVPWTVVQYLNSGILLYKQKLYATALALMSIAVEATLRDVLSTYGYSFVSGAYKVDIYGYSQAQVNVSGTKYTLTFLDPMPRGPNDLSVSAGGVLPVDIKIRREINSAKKRIDLLIKAPLFLIDHLSGNQVVQPAQTNSINGLGEALKIARDIEKVITPLDLPPDVDEVLLAVRNNLIHLSNDSLDVGLPKFAVLSPTGRFTVKNFISKPNLVFDLVTDIPRFVNDQYVKLWKAGKHIR